MRKPSNRTRVRNPSAIREKRCSLDRFVRTLRRVAHSGLRIQTPGGFDLNSRVSKLISCQIDIDEAPAYVEPIKPVTLAMDVRTHKIATKHRIDD